MREGCGSRTLKKYIHDRGYHRRLRRPTQVPSDPCLSVGHVPKKNTRPPFKRRSFKLNNLAMIKERPAMRRV